MYQITYSEEPKEHNRHAHLMYEVIYVVSGCVQICIQNKAFTAQAGSLIFLNQLEEHATTILQTPYHRYYLLLAPHEYDMLIRDARLLSIFKSHGPTFPYVLNATEKSSLIEPLFRHLLYIKDSHEHYSKERVNLLNQLLLLEMYAHFEQAFTAPISSGSISVQHVQQELDQTFTQPFSLHALAERYHISTSTLSRLFKQQVGLTPQQYVMKSRLSLACTLLTNSRMSIREVATQCGFSDINNFIRRFGQEYHMTPREYRFIP